jgi:AcrR family transcriptional regulator
MPRRPRRGTPAATRERLIEAAFDVFNRNGYYGTDSNALARAAGYSPATFYLHFADKRALFLAVYARWQEREWADAERILAEAGTTRAAARRLVQSVAEHHRSARGMRAALRVLVQSDPAVRAAYLGSRRRQMQLMQDLAARHGVPPRSAAERGLVLLLLERVGDAVAHGELRSLGIEPASLLALVERRLAAHLQVRSR